MCSLMLIISRLAYFVHDDGILGPDTAIFELCCKSKHCVEEVGCKSESLDLPYVLRDNDAS